MKVRLWLAAAVAVAAGVAGAGIYRAAASSGGQRQQAMDADMVRTMGLVDPMAKHLSPALSADGDTLLAAAPHDAAKLRDPAQIVFAHLDSGDDSVDVDWKNVERQLAASIGRPVTDLVYDSDPAQLEDIRSGRITVVALHAADTPFLVNEYGFHPIAVLGQPGQGASGNKLDLLVPANSPIASVADVKGHTVTCTVPSSITGYRAGIALLLAQQQLRPNVDYLINWSFKQKASVRGIADGSYEAAFISDDKLQSMVEAKQVDPSKYRSLFQSGVIPRTTIGYFYDLKPELAAKLKAAVLAYKPASADELRCLPVDYKTDFALVRDIDARFDPRLDTKTNTRGKPAKGPATQP